MDWKKIKILFIGLILMCLVVFLVNTDLTEVMYQISGVGFGFVGILIISGASLFMGALAWKLCFIRSEKVGVVHLFMVRTIGEMITSINPTNIVAGEASKVHLLERSNIGTREKTDSILIARVLLISMQLLLTMICIFLFAYKHSLLLQLLWLLAILITLIWSIGKIVSKVKVGHSQRWMRGYVRHIKFARIYLIRFMRRMKNHFSSKPRQLFLACCCSMAHFSLGALELLFIFYLLKLNSNFIDALTVDMGVVIIKSIGGFVPAQIGIEEIGNKYMLAMAGVKGTGVWITVSILRRAKQLFWIMIAGVFYMLLKLSANSRSIDYGNSIYHT